MEKCLLSIDWDYFISTDNENWGSLIENSNNIINLWYKRYLQAKRYGTDIQKLFHLSSEVDGFWDRIKERVCINKDTRIHVSDSHALSYNIANDNRCMIICLFDAHADLGYGGLPSLNFELNCANWLGKLLKGGIIHEANIIYSQSTTEKPEDFRQINQAFNVKYHTWDTIPNDIKVEAIHICRSGAWTPPWFDDKFFEFIGKAGLAVESIGCNPRRWDTKNINLSEQITYMMA